MLPSHYEYLQYLRITINAFGHDLPYEFVMELIREESQLENETIPL